MVSPSQHAASSMQHAVIADRLWSAPTEQSSQAADDGNALMGVAATTPVAVASGSRTTHVDGEAAMSGQRRAARLEIRARALRDRKLSTERWLKGDVGKVERQNRRGGGKSGSQRRPRHADRAEIVGMTVVLVGLPACVVGDRRQQDTGVGLAAAEALEVNVAKRQRKVNRERKQRERCDLPDLGAEPVHFKDQTEAIIELVSRLLDQDWARCRIFIRGQLRKPQPESHEWRIAIGACAADRLALLSF
jgi:hypothetical protein